MENYNFQLIVEQLKLLPPKYRDVLMLTIQGYGTEEVANVLHINALLVNWYLREHFQLLKDIR